MRNVVVVGSGTVGTATAAALVKHNVAVDVFDHSIQRREELAGDLPAGTEADLATTLRAAHRTGMLRILDRLVPRLTQTTYIVCVPTPVEDSGLFDTSAVDAAIADIASSARPHDAICIRSTVPIGTTRRLAAATAEHGIPLHFAAVPDRSIEGRSFADQLAVPHLIGGLDAAASAMAVRVFSPLGQVVDVGPAEAAEAAKLFSNAWRGAVFSLSNAMALVCEDHGLDAYDILKNAGTSYPRFAPPRPGPVCGPCLPKDIRLLRQSAPLGVAELLSGLIKVENQVMAQVTRTLDEHLATRRPEPRVACLGIAFKGRPEVDDARESTASALCVHLRRAWPNADLVGWDAVMTRGQIEKAGLRPADSPINAGRGADLLVICNDHPATATIDLVDLAAALASGALIYDLCGTTAHVRQTLPNAVRHRVFGRGRKDNPRG